MLEVDDIKINVERCIYKENSFLLVDISEEIIGSLIMKDAINHKVLNVNALYKNFIDDNFENDFEIVHDHEIFETINEEGNLSIVMNSLDEEKEIIRSHYVILKSIA